MEGSKSCGKRRQYIAAILGNLAAFCIGNMLGWTSPMQPLLESDNPPVGDQPLTRDQVSWLGSINFVGAITGTLFWGSVSDLVGRRATGCLVALPFLLSWSLILAARDASWLVAARVAAGVGCSGAIINTPMFVTEIAQDDIRGRLGSYLMASVNAGCVFCYIIGSYLSFVPFNIVCLTVPAIYALMFSFMPESPVYLYSKGKTSEARDSLLYYRGGDQIQTDLEFSRIESKVFKKKVSLAGLWGTRGRIKAFLLGLGFIVGQQLCAILVILTYTVEIFKSSGSSLTPHASAIVVGSLQLVSSLVSSMLVDKAGRRILLAVSYIAMAVALLTLGSYFLVAKEEFAGSLRWLPVICLSVHVVAYSIGAGPVPFIVMAETFEPQVRARATSAIQFFGTSLSFASVKTYPLLSEHLGTHGCFWLYGVSCIVLFVFTIFCVPETKGKTLQQILRRMNSEPEDPAAQEMLTVSSKMPTIVSQKSKVPP